MLLFITKSCLKLGVIMSSTYLILTINPGSTSTKFALFKGEEPVLSDNINHSNAELSPFEKMVDQFDMRKSIILDALIEQEINIKEIDAVVGRGGLLKPIPGGTYKVNQRMIDDNPDKINGYDRYWDLFMLQFIYSF